MPKWVSFQDTVENLVSLNLIYDQNKCILTSLMDAITWHIMLRKTSVSTRPDSRIRLILSNCAGNGTQFHTCARHCIQINTSSGMMAAIFTRSMLEQACGGYVATRSWIFQWNLHRSQGLPWFTCPSLPPHPDTAVSQIKDDHSGVHSLTGCQIHFREHSLRQIQKHKQLLELSAPIHTRSNWQHLSPPLNSPS